MKKIRVTVWNEYRHEKNEESIRMIYPNGLHAVIGEFLAECDDIEVTLAALDDPDQGLPDSVLDNTDVLLWWGHMAHGDVKDSLAEKVKNRVYDHGMGFIGLHSAHMSKPFRKIVGTSGNLSWGDEQKEIIWNLMPQHPIAAGIPDHFILDVEEMYGEPFTIPQPDALVFGGWFEHGNIFRSGACFLRGAGKVFYFQPGHESCRSYYNPYVQQIIKNAVHWAAPATFGYDVSRGCPYIRPIV
jgi:trehalose utilization protein